MCIAQDLSEDLNAIAELTSPAISGLQMNFYEC